MDTDDSFEQEKKREISNNNREIVKGEKRTKGIIGDWFISSTNQ